MGLRKFERMSIEDYLAWEAEQEEKHELVDGVPQLMVGATTAHDIVTMNASAWLHGKLRGTRCRVHTAGMRVRCLNDNVRYPDITVACGPFEPTDLLSSEPRIVFEVLSPSTKGVDLLIKLRDYRTVPTLSAYVILWQDEPHALIHRRAGEGWTEEAVIGLEGIVSLPEIDVGLPLAEVYEGLPPA
jgi:Uma2 family endonuclease